VHDGGLAEDHLGAAHIRSRGRVVRRHDEGAAVLGLDRGEAGAGQGMVLAGTDIGLNPTADRKGQQSAEGGDLRVPDVAHESAAGDGQRPELLAVADDGLLVEVRQIEDHGAALVG